MRRRREIDRHPHGISGSELLRLLNKRRPLDRDACPLCGFQADTIHNSGGLLKSWGCKTCGYFQITDDLLFALAAEKDWQQTRALLSKAVRAATNRGKKSLILRAASSVKRAIAMIPPEPSVARKGE